MRLLVLFIFILTFSCARVVVLEDPLSAEEHINLGYIYEKQGKEELAKEEYLKAIKKDRRSWKAYFNLGNLYATRGEWNRAEEYYLKALEIQRDPDVLNNLAYTLHKKGEDCRALRLVKEAIKKGERQEYKETLRDIENQIKERGITCSSFEGEGDFGQ
jgi:Tfp pilus assembly protein PilF